MDTIEIESFDSYLIKYTVRCISILLYFMCCSSSFFGFLLGNSSSWVSVDQLEMVAFPTPCNLFPNGRHLQVHVLSHSIDKFFWSQSMKCLYSHYFISCASSWQILYCPEYLSALLSGIFVFGCLFPNRHLFTGYVSCFLIVVFLLPQPLSLHHFFHL